jgi:protein-S-isoprenylcysteine O-methyltransferase Ste14
MSYFIITVLVLWTGWRAYANARREGTWSNKKFLLALLVALGLTAVILLPVIVLPMSTLQSHEGLYIGSLLVVIAVAETLYILNKSRWKKRE